MEAWHSPFIVPLGAFAVAIVAIAGGIWSDIHNKRIRADQRMAMLSRGMSIDDIEKVLGKAYDSDLPPKDPLRSLSNARRAGIVLVSSGTGVILFFLALTVIVHERDVLAGAAAGLITLAIGIGFFVDYHLQKRELSRFGMEIGSDPTT
jgi:Flp pilus assembly protein TadB